MPDNDAQQDTRLQEVMDEQKQLHVVHEQRLTQVETRITTIEIKLPFLENAITKLTDIGDKLERQTTLNEAAIVAIRDRTDQFADHMEKATDRLTEKQEKTNERIDMLESERISKLENKVGKQDTKWKIAQAILLVLLTIIGTMILSHLQTFFH